MRCRHRGPRRDSEISGSDDRDLDGDGKTGGVSRLGPPFRPGRAEVPADRPIARCASCCRTGKSTPLNRVQTRTRRRPGTGTSVLSAG